MATNVTLFLGWLAAVVAILFFFFKADNEEDE